MCSKADKTFVIVELSNQYIPNQYLIANGKIDTSYIFHFGLASILVPVPVLHFFAFLFSL